MYSVNGINVRTGVGFSKELRDAETRVGRPPQLLAGNTPDRLQSPKQPMEARIVTHGVFGSKGVSCHIIKNL